MQVKPVLVKMRDLRQLPIERFLPTSSPGEGGSPRRWYHRLAGRFMAAMLLNGSDSYQMSGPVNWLYDWKSGESPPYDGDADIQAPKYQLAHWVLDVSGYSCCVADLKGICGDDMPEEKARTKSVPSMAGFS